MIVIIFKTIGLPVELAGLHRTDTTLQLIGSDLGRPERTDLHHAVRENLPAHWM